MTNAALQGRAEHITVELTERPELLVRVADDGVGFDPASLERMSGRHGIVGMRERAEAIGARLEIRSQPGEGTEIVVVLP